MATSSQLFASAHSLWFHLSASPCCSVSVPACMSSINLVAFSSRPTCMQASWFCMLYLCQYHLHQLNSVIIIAGNDTTFVGDQLPSSATIKRQSACNSMPSLLDHRRFFSFPLPIAGQPSRPTAQLSVFSASSPLLIVDLLCNNH